MIPFKNLKLIAVFLLAPFAAFCQDEEHVNNFSYFSNALFLTMLVIIILLAILIVAFSSAFKNIADSDYLLNKYKNENGKSTDTTKTIVSLILLLSSFSLFAQDNAIAVADDWRIGGMDQFTFYFMLAIVLTEVIILALMFYQFNFLIRTARALSSVPQKKKESKIMMSLTDAVAIEEEESILLDHDYDGIKELDNNLPPWWKYGFYLTIVFACIYLVNYHVLGTGDLQGKEYEKDMAQAKLEVEEYMKNSANNVDETTVKYLAETPDLESGKEVFIANCAACHGKLGEGSVGPNLTDDHWLHGGSIQDIFKSVKYGWVEKGMKSWKEDLSPMQIAQLTSFIKSLKGTNPPNPKAPQGDLFIDADKPISDSAAIMKDSLSITVDSMRTGK